MRYKLTIIVPVYNEMDNLNRLEVELSRYLKIASVPTCILFVNDGSTDNSQILIESICNKSEAYQYVAFKNNLGLSAALKAGFDHTKTELVGYIDADLQTHPEDFNILLEYINTHQLVTGQRLNRQDSFIKKMASKIANTIRLIFTNDGVQDTGCPLKILQTEYAKRIPMFSGLHRFLPAMILLQNGSVKQVPVRHFPRKAGTSNFGIRNRILAPLLDCFAFLWIKKRYINYDIVQKHTKDA